jgi:hypothetical protein
LLGDYEAPVSSQEFSDRLLVFSEIFGAIFEVIDYLRRILSPVEHEILGHSDVTSRRPQNLQFPEIPIDTQIRMDIINGICDLTERRHGGLR